MIEVLTLNEFEALLKRRRSLEVYELGAGHAWARLLAVDRRGRVVATAADQASSWIPTPSTLDEAREWIKEWREWCAERHDGPGSHLATCSAYLS